VGGAVAADALIGAGLSRSELLEAALEAEAVVAGRHADNIAPSLYGGAVLVLSLDPPRIVPVKVHDSIGLVLVTPDYPVETAAARAVLPASLPRGEAVAQAAHLGALLLGLERGDVDLVRAATVDRIAEPARRSLYPGYAEARSAALEAGALAVTVSGAGPTLVALVPRDAAAAVGRAFEEGYRRAGLAAVAHPAQVDPAGARVLRELRNP
jgi:homoserine kinase